MVWSDIERPVVSQSVDRSGVTFATNAKNLKLARRQRAYWETIPTDASFSAFHSNRTRERAETKRGAEAPRLTWPRSF
jgi:hypothetical protein